LHHGREAISPAGIDDDDRRFAASRQPAFEMTTFEDLVNEEVRKGRSMFGLYPATDEQALTDFAAWRKKTGR
jgi:hypothetical protein